VQRSIVAKEEHIHMSQIRGDSTQTARRQQIVMLPLQQCHAGASSLKDHGSAESTIIMQRDNAATAIWSCSCLLAQRTTAAQDQN
jgi:hypothetical protein